MLKGCVNTPKKKKKKTSPTRRVTDPETGVLGATFGFPRDVDRYGF